MGVKELPFWAWFHIAKKITEGKLYKVDRNGSPVFTKPPYKFGQRIILPQNYWDDSPWAMPDFNITADDPGGARSRLYVYLQGTKGRDWSRIYYTHPQRFFPRGSGLNWRYELLRRQYGLSAEDSKLVISIEEGKEYSDSNLKVAKFRERQDIEASLALPGGTCQGMSLEGYKALKEMFPYAEVIRIPRQPESFWPTELVTFFRRTNYLGRTWNVPHRPPRNVTFLPLKEASRPQPAM